MSYVIHNGKSLIYNGNTLNFNVAAPLPTSFIFEVNVTNNFELPVQDPYAYNYDFNINWGDGVIEHYTRVQLQSQIPTHSYSSSGTKQVSIDGLFQKVDFSGNPLLLTRILQWGNVGWLDFEQSFRGCHNMVSANGGTANVMNQVTNMSGMFASYQAGEQMSLTSVSLPASLPLVTDMTYMFRECAYLTEDNLILPTSAPNLSSVNNMFRSGGLVNFVIPSYFSNVTSLYHTFRYCPLETISFPTEMNNVEDVRQMFEGSNLTTITLPTSMSSLSSLSQWFYECSSLTDVILPKTLGPNITTSLMFYGCSNLSFVDATNSNINGPGLDAIFTALPTVSSGEISISGSEGENTCTPSIAQSKGWTVS